MFFPAPLPCRHPSVGVGFIQVQNLTGGDVFEHLLLAQWPLDLQALDDGLLAQPYVEPHVAGAQVAAGRIDLAILRDSAGGDAHLGAEAETVAFPAPRLDGQPVIAVAAIVAIEQRRAAAIGDDDVEVAVVVEIGDGGAAAHVLDAKRRSALGRNVLEAAAADVLVEKVALLVAELRVVEFHVVGDVTVGAEDVQTAVVVEVEQLGAERQRQKARLQSGFEGHVLELQFAQVAVQRVVLARKGGEEDVGKAVAVKIGDLGSHAGHRLAVHIETGARGVRNVLERAVALVAVKEIAHAVIGDKDIRPAVQIDVADHRVWLGSHQRDAASAAFRNAAILKRSLRPGELSICEHASTPHGCTCSIAARTLPASSPPARISLAMPCGTRAQSKTCPDAGPSNSTASAPTVGQAVSPALLSTRIAFHTRMPCGYCSGGSLPCNWAISKPTCPAVRSTASGDSSTKTPTFQTPDGSPAAMAAASSGAI